MAGFWDTLRQGLKTEARRNLKTKYDLEHEGKDIYDRVEENRSLKLYARKGMSIILRELKNPNYAPHRTGLGLSIGVKYRQCIKKIGKGRYAKAPNSFYIIVGSENSAFGGQVTPDAPYIAWHNKPRYKDRSTGDITTGGAYENWIYIGVQNAKRALKNFPLNVSITRPKIISRYITKHSGASGASGYIIYVEFSPK